MDAIKPGRRSALRRLSMAAWQGPDTFDCRRQGTDDA